MFKLKKIYILLVNKCLSMNTGKCSKSVWTDGQIIPYKKTFVLNDITQIPLQTYSPPTVCIWGPTTWNSDQTRFESKLTLHIRLRNFFQHNDICENRKKVNITPPFVSDYSSRYPVSDTIQLTFPDLTHLWIFNLTHFPDSTHNSWFESNILIQFY